MSEGFSGKEVQEILDGHLQDWTDEAAELMELENAYIGKFWTTRNSLVRRGVLPDGAVQPKVSDALDSWAIKVDVNLLRAYIRQIMGATAFRRIRVIAEAPTVDESKAGPTKELPANGQQLVQAVADDWLHGRDVQDVTRYARLVTLLWGQSAFKVGWSKSEDGSLLDRLWIQAIPKRGCIWDENASSEREMRYIGHWRQESEAWIIDNLSADDIEGIAGSPLVDHLREDTANPTSYGENVDEGDENYYWVLEFHDLVAKKTRFYVYEGPKGEQEAGVLRHAREEALGYGCSTLIPIIMERQPSRPMRGLSASEAVYQKQGERSLTLTVLANKMRRDVAGKFVGVKAHFDSEKEITKFLSPIDGEVVWAKPGIPLDQVVRSVEHPDIASSLAAYNQELKNATTEERGTADLTQGQQGSYLSATEAELLSRWSESSVGILTKAMDEAVNRAAELALKVLAAHMAGASLRVRYNGRIESLPKWVLEISWRLTAVDSVTTPVARARMQQSLTTVLPMLQQLWGLAFGEPGPDEPPIPAGLRMSARKMIDQIVVAFELSRELMVDQVESLARADSGEQLTPSEATAEQNGQNVAMVRAAADQLLQLQGQVAPGVEAGLPPVDGA